jgi:hypothetical protein
LDLRDWHVIAGGQACPLRPMIRKVYGGAGFEFAADGQYKAESSPDTPFDTPAAFWEVGWAAAEVRVDPETGKVDLLQLVISGDAGNVINHLGARGQDEGRRRDGDRSGPVRGIALRRHRTGQRRGAHLPRADGRRPPAVIREHHPGTGPRRRPAQRQGSWRCAGLLSVPPAIADAVGAQFTELPMTPERMLAALDRARVPAS